VTTYFLISPTTTAPEGKKKQFLLLQAKSEGKSTGLSSFCEPTTTSVWQRGKKDLDCILSCADQAARALLERGRRGGREAGREGRREGERKRKAFLQILQLLSKSKH
jgi:hypothetical protein